MLSRSSERIFNPMRNTGHKYTHMHKLVFTHTDNIYNQSGRHLRIAYRKCKHKHEKISSITRIAKCFSVNLLKYKH